MIIIIMIIIIIIIIIISIISIIMVYKSNSFELLINVFIIF